MRILSFILGYYVGKLVTTTGSWSAAGEAIVTRLTSLVRK